jgi:hypothetical protein
VGANKKKDASAVKLLHAAADVEAFVADVASIF